MEQMSFTDLKPGITPEKMMRDTDAWIARNRTLYFKMTGEARRCARQGKKTSISKLVESIRFTEPINGDTEGFKVNNTIRAGLARRMIRDFPELADVIETRSSKADWL